ncbi:MAG: TRAP transporter large permease subunit, partial [Alphaproteobacteria bacterium]
GERGLDGSLGREVLRSLLPPVVLIVAVLGSILAGIATPTEAASVGAVGATLLGAYRLGGPPPAAQRGILTAVCRLDPHGRSILGAGLAILAMLVITAFFDLRLQRATIPPADMAAIAVCILLAAIATAGLALSFARVLATGILTAVMRSTLEVASMVFVILIGAALFSLTFRGLGGDRLVESFLTDLPGGTVGAIVVVMLAIFLLGFFLDFLEIVFIVVPIVGPILLQMEFAPGQPVDPVWLGIMIAVNLQTSFLTPPFGFALFYLRGVAPPEVTTMHIYRGVVPFVAMQLSMLVILWFAPGLATWLPGAIFG